MGFLFIAPGSIEGIINKLKTKTRRPKRSGELLINGVLRVRGRVKWQVGRDYAIVPGRGKCGIPDGRIRILSIREEQVRDITDADAVAEGYENHGAFLLAWIGLYGKRADFGALCWVVEFEFVPSNVQKMHVAEQMEMEVQT